MASNTTSQSDIALFTNMVTRLTRMMEEITVDSNAMHTEIMKMMRTMNMRFEVLEVKYGFI